MFFLMIKIKDEIQILYNQMKRIDNSKQKKNSSPLLPYNTFSKIKDHLKTLTNEIEGTGNQLDSYLMEAEVTKWDIHANLSRIHSMMDDVVKEWNEKVEHKSKQEKIALEGIFNFMIELLQRQNIYQIDSPKRKALRLLEIECHISVIPEFLPTAFTLPPDITFYPLPLPQKHPLTPHLTIVQPTQRQREKLASQYEILRTLMQITTASVVTERSVEGWPLQKCVFGLCFPRFFFASSIRLLKCYRLWRNPKVEMIGHVWNLPQNGAIKSMKSITYPSITTSFHLYIPAKKMKNSSAYDIFEQNQEDEQVRVLLLYEGKLQIKDQRHQKYSCSCCDVIPEQDLETIIVYIHGGGFIALSSSTMQTYTRKWANELHVPIFCIDYRKPPEFRFPTAVHDCVAVYEFITNHIHRYFNIRPRKIILAGDSAGGNLACSLEAIILKTGLHPPAGMYLAYPAVDTRKQYSPSRLNAFHDAILLPKLLLLCLHQYLGSDPAIHHWDPLASPILLTESYVQGDERGENKEWPKNWPKTVIMVGDQDPLYDDSIRLIQRLVSSNIDAKMIIYCGFSHAFLSMDMVINGCCRIIRDSIEELRSLLQC